MMMESIIERLEKLKVVLRRNTWHEEASALFDIIKDIEQEMITAKAIQSFTRRQEEGENPLGDLNQYLSWVGARASTIAWALGGEEKT